MKHYAGDPHFEGLIPAGGVDWQKSDLTELCKPELVVAFRSFRVENEDALGPVPDVMLSGMADALAKLAYPYLEARALMRGDTLLAEKMRTASERLKRIRDSYKPSFYDRRKNIDDIAEAWGTNGTEGWQKLGELVGLIRHSIEAELGSTIEEQLSELRRGTLITTERWAVMVRAAVLISLTRRIPLRVSSVSKLRMGWWHNAPASSSREFDVLRKWEGAITIALPPSAMKSKRPFNPPYILPEKCGVDKHERSTHRDLLELYFSTGGARERILTTVDEKTGVESVLDSPYVFPSVARRGAIGHGLAGRSTRKKPGSQWCTAAISLTFEEIVRANAKALGLDVSRLEKLFGSMSFHVIRLLFGTFWAPRELVNCSLMLHHADINTTARLYCGKTERTVSLEE